MAHILDKGSPFSIYILLHLLNIHVAQSPNICICDVCISAYG